MYNNKLKHRLLFDRLWLLEIHRKNPSSIYFIFYFCPFISLLLNDLVIINLLLIWSYSCYYYYAGIFAYRFWSCGHACPINCPPHPKGVDPASCFYVAGRSMFRGLPFLARYRPFRNANFILINKALKSLAHIDNKLDFINVNTKSAPIENFPKQNN